MSSDSIKGSLKDGLLKKGKSHIVKVSDLQFSYPGHRVLCGADISVYPSEFVAIVGSNGAGKSTLFKLMLKQLMPEVGKIELFGTDIKHFSDYKKIGYLPQLREFNSGFPATVWEVVCTGLQSHSNIFGRPDKKGYELARQALALTGMQGYKSRLIGKLSGGELQRIMLARLLCSGAQLFLLDEPSTGIDKQATDNMFELLIRLKEEQGITTVMVTHDEIRAANYADRVYILAGGVLKETSPMQV